MTYQELVDYLSTVFKTNLTNVAELLAEIETGFALSEKTDRETIHKFNKADALISTLQNELSYFAMEFYSNK